MKIKTQYYRLWAVGSVLCVIAACTSSGTNNTQELTQDTSKHHQYGQQPRDSSTTNLSPADSTKNVKTNQGNADPSGRQKNQ